MDTILILVDAVLVISLGVWMAAAVLDNWRYPKLNHDAVAMVIRFELMAEHYPDDFAQLAHRRIDDPRISRWMFLVLRFAETIAALALLTSGGLLVLAAFGLVSVSLASGLAIASAAIFVTTWAGFLIGGNYFAYWYCHPWAQSNHFMLLYWGFFVLITLKL